MRRRGAGARVAVGDRSVRRSSVMRLVMRSRCSVRCLLVTMLTCRIALPFTAPVSTLPAHPRLSLPCASRSHHCSPCPPPPGPCAAPASLPHALLSPSSLPSSLPSSSRRRSAPCAERSSAPTFMSLPNVRHACRRMWATRAACSGDGLDVSGHPSIHAVACRSSTLRSPRVHSSCCAAAAWTPAPLIAGMAGTTNAVAKRHRAEMAAGRGAAGSGGASASAASTGASHPPLRTLARQYFDCVDALIAHDPYVGCCSSRCAAGWRRTVATCRPSAA